MSRRKEGPDRDRRRSVLIFQLVGRQSFLLTDNPQERAVIGSGACNEKTLLRASNESGEFRLYVGYVPDDEYLAGVRIFEAVRRSIGRGVLIGSKYRLAVLREFFYVGVKRALPCTQNGLIFGITGNSNALGGLAVITVQAVDSLRLHQQGHTYQQQQRYFFLKSFATFPSWSYADPGLYFLIVLAAVQDEMGISGLP
jgi:hypothetical protein